MKFFLQKMNFHFRKEKIMKDLDDFIAKLDEADEEDRQEIRELSNNLRK